MKLYALVAVAALAGGCASDGDDAPPAAPDPTSPTSTTALVLGTDHQSVATVTIDGEPWIFDATCAQPAEGEILVWGSGFTPDDALPAELLLEASATAPYVGITGGGRLIEAAVDDALILTIDAGTISGEGIQFVADADIETGVGTPLGVGSVTVACSTYAEVPLPE